MRYAIRMLAKSPNFTLISVLVLALGIGANTAIFSIVNALMIEPLPYRNAAQIVVPATVFKKQNTDRGSNSFSDFLDWKAQTQLFDSVALFVQQPYDVTGGERPERLRGAVVTEDYFRITGAVPIIGRTFVAEENQPKANRVVVLSYSLWMRRFGGDPKIAGTTIELAGVPRQVVGVMGKDAEWPDDIDLWVPLGFGTRPPEWALRRDNHIWQTVARLRSGVSLGQAQAQLDVMARRIEKDYPESRGGTGWKLHPLAQWIVGGELRQILFILLSAVGLVLSIACVNIANLLLARGAAREREIAIRTALGARWPRLVRQMLTESLLLSTAGGALGLLLAWWGVRAVVHYAPEGTPRLNEIGIDPVVLAFTMFLSILTAVLFGLIPAMHTVRIAPLESMRDGGRSATSGIGRRRLRSLLVVSELALSVLLLVGAGLLIRSFARLQQVNPGFSTQNLISMEVALPNSRYAGPPQVVSAFRAIQDAIRSIPGVSAAAAVGALPAGGGGFYLGRAFLVEGRPEPPAGTDANAAWNAVQPEYLQMMGVPLVRGRFFTDRDEKGNTPVMILSQSMADEMFPNQNPIGRRVRSWRDENVYREVVGVVGDVKHYNLTDHKPNVVYVPHGQDPWETMIVVARTQSDPRRLLPAIQAAIWSKDNRLAIAEIRTMDEVIATALARPRFIMFLLAIFAGIALLLATVGIYGVMSYIVAQRRQEIGLRMALGAQIWHVLSSVLGHGMAMTAAGILIGLVGAAALTRAMAGLLFGVTPHDPLTFIVGAGFLALTALVACYVPARRATKVDPMVALRYE